jgi:anti-sigma B factor antagonist
MNITVRAIDDCTVLDLDGKLVLGPATMELRNAVRDVAKSNPRKIVLNLRRLTYIDSCGLGELASSYSHVKGQGGNLVLLDPPDKIMSPLILVKLETIFEIFKDEQSAIAVSKQIQKLRQMAG